MDYSMYPQYNGYIRNFVSNFSVEYLYHPWYQPSLDILTIWITCHQLEVWQLECPGLPRSALISSDLSSQMTIIGYNLFSPLLTKKI